jgi:hypothetical protein
MDLTEFALRRFVSATSLPALFGGLYNDEAAGGLIGTAC